MFIWNFDFIVPSILCACFLFKDFLKLGYQLWSIGAFLDTGAGAGAGVGAGVGFSNFWKSRVRVQWGMTIKKLLKIFLFIFSIYSYY